MNLGEVLSLKDGFSSAFIQTDTGNLLYFMQL